MRQLRRGHKSFDDAESSGAFVKALYPYVTRGGLSALSRQLQREAEASFSAGRTHDGFLKLRELLECVRQTLRLWDIEDEFRLELTGTLLSEKTTAFL